LSAASERALLAHPWPGNVRELFNSIQRAALVARGETIEPADLGLSAAVADASSPAGTPEERAVVEETLKRHEGSVSRAAEELGLSRQAFYRKMDRLGIVLERRLRE
jgi:transcriptional regulator of acetoin/glycerol metabolism